MGIGIVNWWLLDFYNFFYSLHVLVRVSFVLLSLLSRHLLDYAAARSRDGVASGGMYLDL